MLWRATTQSETIPHALQHVTHQAIAELCIDCPCHAFSISGTVFAEVTSFIFFFQILLDKSLLIVVKAWLLLGFMRQGPKNLVSHHF